MDILAIGVFVVVCLVVAWWQRGSRPSDFVALPHEGCGSGFDDSFGRRGGTDVVTDPTGLALAYGPRAAFGGPWGFGEQRDESCDRSGMGVVTEAHDLGAAFYGPMGLSDQ
jgi:hypothetical protein